MTLRRYVARVRAADLEHAYDILLPVLPHGVHEARDGDRVELVVLGADGELPPVEEVAAALDELLLEPIVVEDAGADLAAALAALRRSWDIGGRIVLRTAEQPPPAADRVDVVLDHASGGFGTGAHPTTRHCLELVLGIEHGGAFADLGCGAGALTIAAAKLGFAPVTGVELLEGAAAAAAGNAQVNAVEVAIVQGNLLELDLPPARVAVVNVSELPVHSRLASWGWPGGEALVVSGLSRREELEQALAWYAAGGWSERARVDREGWPAVLLEPDLQRG